MPDDTYPAQGVNHPTRSLLELQPPSPSHCLGASLISNCRPGHNGPTVKGNLSVSELHAAEGYWLMLSQADFFAAEISALKASHHLPTDSNLVPLKPFLDSAGVLRVGGCESNSTMAFAKVQPVILHGKHPLTKVMVRTEHLRLLHAGPTLLPHSPAPQDCEIAYPSVHQVPPSCHQAGATNDGTATFRENYPWTRV